jgi:predicted HTH domain antitoxin
MTTLHIPDDVLKQAGLMEQEALVELACRLFQTGRLTLFFAARLAGMPQAEFEDVLLERKIPIYDYTADDLENDLRTLRAGGLFP